MMFSPYKKKRFATVAIIFAVFFHCSTGRNICCCFCNPWYLPHTRECTYVAHSFIIVFFYSWKRTIFNLSDCSTIQQNFCTISTRRAKATDKVLFPKWTKSAEHHHFPVKWRKAGTGWRHPRIILGRGHANRSFIRQILNFQGTERFPTAYTLESGVLRARLIHGSSRVSTIQRSPTSYPPKSKHQQLLFCGVRSVGTTYATYVLKYLAKSCTRWQSVHLQPPLGVHLSIVFWRMQKKRRQAI
jgi:hypothetical protein